MQESFLLVVSSMHPIIDEKRVLMVTRFPVASRSGINIETLIIAKHKIPRNKRNLDVKYIFENILDKFFKMPNNFSLILIASSLFEVY
ncbi:MAG: hypothetical protein ACRC41_18495 [Sarcina sp.]